MLQATCPYCSTAVAVAAPADGPLRRVVCRRCGESFTPDGVEAADPVAAGILPDAADPAAAGTMRALAPLALIGATVAAVVFSVGLYSIFRGDKPDARRGAESVAEPAGVAVSPLALPGLAYLPADANVLFAVQPAALRTYAAGQKLDPRQLLQGLGVPAELFATLDQAGVPFDSIDQLVGGLSLTPGSAIPRGVVVLTLAAPPDLAALKTRLKAASAAAVAGKPRYKVTIRNVPAEWLILDARTHLFATDAADLERAGSPGQKLLPGVRESVARLPGTPVAWLATDSADWAALDAVKLAAQLAKRPDVLERLAGLRAFAAAATLAPDPRLRLAVQAPGGRGPQLEASARAAAAGKPVQLKLAGDWLEADAPLDGDGGRAAVGEWLSAWLAGK